MATYGRVHKSYVAMTRDEVWRFIDAQRTMFVAFGVDDDFPHLTPVWYVLADQKLYFRTSAGKMKARLADAGRVCCSIADGERFTELRGVMVRGRTRLVSEADLVERYRQLKAVKYAGLTSADLEVPDLWSRSRGAEAQAIIEIAPERISSWDNRKLASWREEVHIGAET